MYRVNRTNQFKKDFKKPHKRGKQAHKLQLIIIQLSEGKTLSRKHRDHTLAGDYQSYRECHVEPDWLLIYRIDVPQNTLFLIRTGSHSDLFG